jgi:hypothetical protein
LPDDATDFCDSDFDLEAVLRLDEKIVFPICPTVEVNGKRKDNVAYNGGFTMSWISERLVEKLGSGGQKQGVMCAVGLLGVVTDVHTPATYLIPVKVCVHTQYLGNG